jgi:hypothetical protein
VFGCVSVMSVWLGGVVVVGFGGWWVVVWGLWLRSLIALRSVAIASNLTFIAYASAAHLLPVLVLHAALLPINAWRLWQCALVRIRARRFRTHLANTLERRPS